MDKNIWLIVVVIWGTCDMHAEACSSHGLVQAANYEWSPASSTGGVVSGSLTLESSLVPPTSSTTCVAGIGLGTSAEPLPPGMNVVGLEIVVLDTSDGSSTPITAFAFASSSATTAALAAGSGSSSVPGTNPLFAGSTWFGFASDVEPFVVPVLGPNEITAFRFTVEAAEALLPLTLTAQVAGGEGESSGVPIFTGDHPAQYFTAAQPFVTFRPVPEPATWMLALCAGASGLARRRATRVG